MSTDRDKDKLEFLLKAIDDTQSTIRFTDTKAATVLLFWSFLINGILRTKEQWYEWMISYTMITFEGIVIYFLVVLMMVFFLQSIWLVYMTIAPKNNPNEHIQKHMDTPGLFYLSETSPSIFSNIKYLYFNNPELKLSKTTETYLRELQNLSDDELYEELIMELQKTSYIRALKLYRAHVAISKIFYTIISLFFLTVYGFITSQF